MRYVRVIEPVSNRKQLDAGAQGGKSNSIPNNSEHPAEAGAKIAVGT